MTRHLGFREILLSPSPLSPVCSVNSTFIYKTLVYLFKMRFVAYLIIQLSITQSHTSVCIEREELG